ncbi:Lrp/AsnC family transcriptional regulator [Christensenellaceae bacterium OttesenSCG-928-L17]|nr:Lrp/AsnC family transcriptional regulator [Christensenellaceae bacterium OttesenSCG-928-L17]
MDSTDAKILEILQEDGRISMQKLASKINMSAPSTIERVKKLEESGAILGYKAVVNPEKVGRSISAIVLVSVTIDNKQKFQEYVDNCPNVLESMEITGRFGYCLKTACKDADTFLDMTYELFAMGLTESYVIMTRPVRTFPIRPILN